jgi:hypothetical protein
LVPLLPLLLLLLPLVPLLPLVSVLLLGRFLPAFLKKGVFMPAVPMIILSIVGIVLAIVALVRS